MNYTCVFCANDFVGYGNNPAPLTNKGRCCDECNCKIVIPYRFMEIMSKRNNENNNFVKGE